MDSGASPDASTISQYGGELGSTYFMKLYNFARKVSVNPQLLNGNKLASLKAGFQKLGNKAVKAVANKAAFAFAAAA